MSTEKLHRPLPADDVLKNIATVADLGRVFFCGIGGSGMSVLAQILHQEGIRVSGSDRVDSDYVKHLRDDGIQVIVGQSAANITDVDTVVWSSAIPESSPEIQEALRQGLRVAHRSDILAVLLKSHRSIAVAGTHGKTTTSSMSATILSSAGVDPSFAIGGSLKTEHGTIPGGHVGEGTWMVAEADESDGSFEKYRPSIGIITNAEGDHLDHYGDVSTYRKAFVEFAAHATDAVVLCGDDAGARQVFAASSDAVVQRIVVYSTSSRSDFEHQLVREGATTGLRNALFLRIVDAEEIPVENSMAQEENTSAVSSTGSESTEINESDIEERFTLQIPEALLTYGENKTENTGVTNPKVTDFESRSVEVNLRVPGIHNARNATAAIAATLLAGVSLPEAFAGLSNFLGAARRFDFQGEVAGVRVYNDYAHHPTEVAVLLDTMRRRFPESKIRVLFQPHTYSRTATYTQELVEALKKADDIVLSGLFAARENPEDYPGITSRTLIDEAIQEGVGSRFELIDDMFEAGRVLATRSMSGDVIVTVGGGDIDRVNPLILQTLSTQSGISASTQSEG